MNLMPGIKNTMPYLSIINIEFYLCTLLCRDNVEWDEEQENQAIASVLKNSSIKLDDEQTQKYEEDADKFWDAFYDIHQNR